MKIEGNIVSKVRVLTGLHSFDRAFINRIGDIGFPLGTATEIYGKTHCGKSTIIYSLAGMIANKYKGDIALLDLEGFDSVFFESVVGSTGFDNTVYLVQENSDEDALKKLAGYLINPKLSVNVAVLDSVGAISPIGETEGDIGDRNMGQRAFAMGQFSRKFTKVFREEVGREKALFMTNHSYPNIGTRGSTTPGGEVKNYLATIRIDVRRKFYQGKYEEYPDGSYIIKGKVVKNRWGLKDQEFELFVLSGYGVHLGLTAFLDALNLKLVKKVGRSYKIGDTSFGTLKNIIDEANKKNDEFFLPFFDALSTNGENAENIIVEDLEDGEINESEDTETELEDNQQD